EVSVTPWLPLDSLAWAVALHWQSGGNAIQEIQHALALTRVDEAMLVLAAPPALGDATPYHVPPGTDYSRLPLDDALAGLSLLGPSDTIESSGWAVSGARTASGRPLLAVAPGGPVQMPSPWYENSLFC